MRRIPMDTIRTVLDEAQEIIELSRFDGVQCVAVPTLDLNSSFNEQSFKEQLMTGGASVLSDAIWHRLSACTIAPG